MPSPGDARTIEAVTTLNVPVHQAVAETYDAPVAYAERIWALFHLQDVAEKTPRHLDATVLQCLGRTLQDPRLGDKRQDLFLARKAAEVLLALTGAPQPLLAEGAWTALIRTLATTRGLAHRGTAETVGALPCLDNQMPRTESSISVAGPVIAWDDILQRVDFGTPIRLKYHGRSLVTRNGKGGQSLVVKVARAGQDPRELAREAFWMDYLADSGRHFGCRFEVPVPLVFRDARLIRAARLPGPIPAGDSLHPEGWAIAYLAPEDYFVYPNDPCPERRPGPESFSEIMARGARLLGTLSSAGIIHDAPIALFHNRIQRHRRRDAGRYEWFRGGRLDRWLASCAYPNWGPTGLRDFEHLIAFTGQPLHLYRHLGNHFLSLLLVAGSYFRVRDSRRVGLQPDGHPVDARELFDVQLLARIVEDIFRGYYRGFVGQDLQGSLPLDTAGLASRMVEEMGVDRHMIEILRVADQTAMSAAEFGDFLSRRGISPEQIVTMEQGGGDLAVPTGPHLGGFNQTISLPELITAVETMAATCIAGRYRSNRGKVSPG